MLSLKESLKILKETNALIEGHFILSSGLHSSKYVQCAQLMSKPNQARSKFVSHLQKKLKMNLKF
jgi:orotate phosphoribosyltransferase